MRTTLSAIIVAKVLLLSISLRASENLPMCEGLVPLEQSFYFYPSYDEAAEAGYPLTGTRYIHIFIEGFVTVEFTVQSTGEVHNVKVLESENNPTREWSEATFSGFLDFKVINTIKAWKFKPISSPCVTRYTARVVFDRGA